CAVELAEEHVDAAATCPQGWAQVVAGRRGWGEQDNAVDAVGRELAGGREHDGCPGAVADQEDFAARHLLAIGADLLGQAVAGLPGGGLIDQVAETVEPSAAPIDGHNAPWGVGGDDLTDAVGERGTGAGPVGGEDDPVGTELRRRPRGLGPGWVDAQPP